MRSLLADWKACSACWLLCCTAWSCVLALSSCTCCSVDSACKSKNCWIFCWISSNWLSWLIFNSRCCCVCATLISSCSIVPNCWIDCCNCCFSDASRCSAWARGPSWCSIFWYWWMNCSSCWVWALRPLSKFTNCCELSSCCLHSVCCRSICWICCSSFCCCWVRGSLDCSKACNFSWTFLNSAPTKSRSWIHLRTSFNASWWVLSNCCSSFTAISAWVNWAFSLSNLSCKWLNSCCCCWIRGVSCCTVFCNCCCWNTTARISEKISKRAKCSRSGVKSCCNLLCVLKSCRLLMISLSSLCLRSNHCCCFSSCDFWASSCL